MSRFIIAIIPFLILASCQQKDEILQEKNLWDQAEYNIYPESETQFFQLESMDRFDFVIEGEQVLALLYNTGTRLVKIQE